MTGLERNSEVVQLAAYAPLFVHANFVNWPTNLIVIDNHRRGSVGAPHLCASLDSRVPSGRLNPSATLHHEHIIPPRTQRCFLALAAQRLMRMLACFCCDSRLAHQ